MAAYGERDGRTRQDALAADWRTLGALADGRRQVGSGWLAAQGATLGFPRPALWQMLRRRAERVMV